MTFAANPIDCGSTPLLFKATMPNTFPSNDAVFSVPGEIGLMVWEAPTPGETSVWLEKRGNACRLVLAENGAVRAAAKFNLDADPRVQGVQGFERALNIQLTGPVFASLPEAARRLPRAVETLEMHFFIARTAAEHGRLVISLDETSIEEVRKYAKTEHQAGKTEQTIKSLAGRLFNGDAKPSAELTPAKAPSIGRH